jgi:hypothetical protein
VVSQSRVDGVITSHLRAGIGDNSIIINRLPPSQVSPLG